MQPPMASGVAFDPDRKAILLAAGDKAGGSGQRFDKQRIARADERLAAIWTEGMKQWARH